MIDLLQLNNTSSERVRVSKNIPTQILVNHFKGLMVGKWVKYSILITQPYMLQDRYQQVDKHVSFLY